jgi:filamentous hemagglutinin family protein
MTFESHAPRLAGFAVALGLGAAVATGHGVAAAAPGAVGASSGSGPAGPAASGSPTSAAKGHKSTGASGSGSATALGTAVGTGGAHTATTSSSPGPAATPAAADTTAAPTNSVSPHKRFTRRPPVATGTAPASSVTSSTAATLKPALKTTSHTDTTAATPAATTPSRSAAVTPDAIVNTTPAAVTTPAPTSAAAPALTALSTALRWVLNPLVNTNPQDPPTDSPLAWTALAWARRQIGALTATAAAATQTTQSTSAPVTAAAAAISDTAATSDATKTVSAAQNAPAGPAANARPSGGTVVAGSATIAQAGTTTTISQSSQRAVINFQSFDVGSEQSVDFQQPSSSAVTLVRVTGPEAAELAGQIDANGQVVLVSREGVTVYQGAELNAAGVIMSTADVTNAHFMAGKLIFSEAGAPTATITNDTGGFPGGINAASAGAVVLLAPDIVLNGDITAQLGHVDLIGADTATIDNFGDALQSVKITGPVQTSATSGPLIRVNDGAAIDAQGGTILVTGAAADGLVTNIANIKGTLDADSVNGKTGSIVVDGSGAGVAVSGTLSAQGTPPGTKGGDIDVLATGNVQLTATSELDAAGSAGGGIIALGLTLQQAEGGSAGETAPKVIVAKGATLDANATMKGHGGIVDLTGSSSVNFAGAITAEGGPSGGNGGTVTFDAPKLAINTGTENVSAPKGTPGTVTTE